MWQPILQTKRTACVLVVVYTLATNNQSGARTGTVMETKAVSPSTPIFKVIIAGEGGVGKTSIIRRYLCECSSEPVMTVGSEFAYQELNYNSHRMGLSIWDFGGEDRFRDLMPIFCLGAHGAFLVFDLSRYSTFLQLEFWIEVIRNSTDGIPVVLGGAKSDLKGGPSDEDIRAFCHRNDICAFFPVSAVTGENIDHLFIYLAQQMMKATEEGRLTPAYSLKA